MSNALHRARFARVLVVLLLALGACSDDPVAPSGRPQVEILAPAAGIALDARDAILTFRVTSADATAWAVALNGAVPVRTESSVKAGTSVDVPLTLNEGANVAVVSVFDAAGQADSVTWTLLVRSAERASFVLEGPETGAVFTSPELALVFEVSGPATRYEVLHGDDVLAAGDDPSGRVSAALTLNEGVNTLELLLFDAAGESQRETLVYIYQTEALRRPGVLITAPANGAILQVATAEVRFRITDAPASGYRLVAGDFSHEVVAPLAADTEHLEQVPLADGSNTLTVTVFDTFGEAASASIALVVARPDAPVITITTPTQDAVLFDAEVQVEGTVTGATTIASVTYALNGGEAQDLTLDGDHFSFPLALAIGEHTLVLTATDELGVSAQATIDFSRDTDAAPPTLNISHPRDTQALKTRRALIRGLVTDNHQVDRVELRYGAALIPATLDGGRFEAWLDLEPGMNTVTVEAHDLSGNTSLREHRVYFGQRLGAGGSHGGAIKDGRIFTWGRNNLTQTGQGYASHETRTAWCERALTGAANIDACKAQTLTNVQALCNTVHTAGTDAANTCRAAAATARDALCDLAPAAPATCKTQASTNLTTLCDTHHGAGTAAAAACKVDLVCAPTFEDPSGCAAVLASIPSAFPSPPPPYAPVALTDVVTADGTDTTAAALGLRFVSLAFNQNASSALDADGHIWSWGDGGSGMLCLGDTQNRDVPHQVASFGAPGTRAIAISRGYDHLLALRSDGTVWGCGLNSVGQLGDGTSGTANSRALPVQVAGLPGDVVQVLASSQSSYALTASGEVWAWGRNQYGNLGQGTASAASEAFPVPAKVLDLTEVLAIAGGRDHVIAARKDGSLYAWGLNASGQVAPLEGNQLRPVQVPGVSDAFGVYANGNQGFYEDAAGRLLGWGQNGNTANLGIPESANQPLPTIPVFGLSAITDSAIGATHGFAMRGDTVFAWGWSFHGSLGGGNSTIHAWGYRTPILVSLP